MKSLEHPRAHKAWKVFVPVAMLIIVGATLVWYSKNHKQARQTVEDTTVAEEYTPITYKMVDATTTEAKFRMPVILDFSNKVVMDDVNDQLTTLKKSFTCLSPDAGNVPEDDIQYLREELQARNKYSNTKYTDEQITKMTKEQLIDALDWYYGVSVEVTNSTKNIFSVEIGQSVYCGGAHPSAFDSSVTFDMNTGKQVEFKDLFTDKAAFDFDNPGSTVGDALALAIFPDVQATSTPDEDSCSLAETNQIARENFVSSTYFIKDEKLFVVPSLPHVIEACAEPQQVDLTKIAQYIDTKGILGRLK